MKYVCSADIYPGSGPILIKCSNADVYYQVMDKYYYNTGVEPIFKSADVSGLCPESYFYQSCGLVPVEAQKNVYKWKNNAPDSDEEAKYLCGFLCTSPSQLYGYKTTLKDPLQICSAWKSKMKPCRNNIPTEIESACKSVTYIQKTGKKRL